MITFESIDSMPESSLAFQVENLLLWRSIMNRFIVLLLLLLSLVSVQTIAVESTPPVIDEPLIPEGPVQSAVIVSVGSIGGAIDSASIRALRRITGIAVATGIVDVFVVTSPRQNGPIPFEGGLVFCAEAGFNVFDFEFNGFVDELKSVQPKSGTFYSIDLVDRCPVTLDDDGIACTEDAKICPDGTGVGRVPPNCNFALCPGENIPDDNDVIKDFMDDPDQGDENQNNPPRGNPIPVEPDNGIGDGAGPIPLLW
jgi:hypothetical protein